MALHTTEQDTTEPKPAHAEPGPVRRRWRPSWLPLLAAGLALAGMIAMVYPTAAAWVSQYNQSALIDAHNSVSVADLHPSAVEQLDAASRYNAALASGAQLEANHRVPSGVGTSSDQGLDYNELLRSETSDIMARLRIPVIDLDLPVYHGTSDETLEKGVGHLEGTSLPVGGVGTHAVLTGHRGLAEATLFTHLNQVDIGDRFTIEVVGEVLTYSVINVQVVEPDETASLRTVEGHDLVTLVTCTPLGINSQRILVTGERITPTPVEDIQAAGAPSTLPHFPWWIVILTVGTLAIGWYVWRSGYPGPPVAKRGARAAAD